MLGVYCLYCLLFLFCLKFLEKVPNSFCQGSELDKTDLYLCESSGEYCFKEDLYKMNKGKILEAIITNLSKLSILESEQHAFQHCCEQFLKSCYLAGKLNIEFNSEDKSSIGFLISRNIKHIDSCIFKLGYSFDSNKVFSALQLRSGIQFIIDNFKDFPTPNGRLEDDLKMFDENESLETLDEAISSWKEDTCIDLDGPGIEDIRKPDGIPDTHTWWPQ